MKKLLPLFLLFSIRVFPQLSGVYTIGGTNPNYSTISQAVTALLSQGVSGPVTFNIRTGTYNEQVYISNIITGASLTNSITFQAETGDSTDVDVTYNGVVFNLLGDYIRMKHITITNTSNSFSRAIDAGASDCFWVENCIVKSPSASSGNVIYGYCTYITVVNSFISSGSPNDYINASCQRFTFKYNAIACSLNVKADTAWIENNFISNNIDVSGCTYLNLVKNNFALGDAWATHLNCMLNVAASIDASLSDTIFAYGNTVSSNFYIFSASKCNIDSNHIRNLSMYNASNGRDSVTNNIVDTIETSDKYLFCSRNLMVKGSFGGLKTYFERNDISNARFVYIDHLFITNNFIRDKFDVNYVDSTCQIKHNNFNATSSNMFFGYNYCTFYFYDNNCTSPFFINLGTTFNRNYNNYYPTPGSEPNSTSFDPQYISSADLHAQNSLLYGKGLYFSQIPIDIDGTTRPNPPTIGANEVSALVSTQNINSPRDFLIYPNPSASGIFYLNTFGGYQATSVEIYNLLGEKIFLSLINQLPNNSINISSQSQGVYIYKILSENKTVAAGKLVIE